MDPKRLWLDRMMSTKFYDADPPGGGGDPKPNEDDKSGAGEEQLPNTPEEWKKFYETKTAEHTKALGAVSEERDHFKKKLGRQAQDLDGYKKIKQAAKTDPKGLVELLAEQHGLGKIQFDDGKNPAADFFEKFTQAEGDDKNELLKQFIQNVSGQANEAVLRKINPILNPMIERDLQTRYGDDWAEYEEDREGMAALSTQGGMAPQELFHLAAVGRNVKEIIAEADKTAFERGRKDAFEEVRKNMQEGVTRTGVHLPAEKKPDDKSGKETLKTALKVLNEIRR